VEAGTFQSQPDDPAEPAEGAVEGVDEEGHVSTPERSSEEIESTFDPGTGDLAEPRDDTGGHADGEAADNA